MNTFKTSSEASMIQSGGVLDEVWNFVMATRTELFLFCAAVAAYHLLFANQRPSQKAKTRGGLKAKQPDMADDDPGDGLNSRSQVSDPRECEKIEKSFRAAFESGDYRQALRCWAVMKRFESAPSVCLAHVVESMQRFKKDGPTILRELRTFFKKFPCECEISVVNDLLESLGRRLDSDLVDKIVELMATFNVKQDQRTYEILLNMHFMTRSFAEVKRLVGEMHSQKVPLTTRATIVVIKTALKTNNFEEATQYFRELKTVWSRIGGEGTPSSAPRHIVAQLVDLACKDHQLSKFLSLLEGVPITDEVVGTMLTECVHQKDVELAQRVERLARAQNVPLSDATYSLIVKGLSGHPTKVQELFNEVVAKGNDLTADFALALLAFCTQNGSVSLASRLYEYMKPKQLPVISAFIRFYAESEQPERACDVYQQHLRFLQSSGDGSSDHSLFLDSRIERSLMNAALRCGRNELAKTLLDAAPSDVAKHIAMIRSCATAGNLQGAKDVFAALQRSGVELNSVVYNTVLDACVACRDIKSAEAWMKQTKEVGLTDVVSYNTLIKAHLQEENFVQARVLMEEMKEAGLQPNRVTFNELVNGMVTRGSQAQREEIWKIIKEMKEMGVKPNQVTCSILLKNLDARSSELDINETMDLITSMDEPMDEVLLSSVVEACVRIGKPDLLSSKLKQLQGAGGSASVNGSHTFGSLIKAYGHAKDIEGVWRCWKEMRSRHIRPTSITLGCMVEAVVSNGDPEGAFELIHQIQEDERCSEALNSVIYCSVLKGFTREKKLQRVCAVYEEMVQRKVDLSVVTYNTLIDACARCGRMERVPEIVKDMKDQGIRPNLITYSTMVKGHCQVGEIQKGFAIFEEMRTETKLRPDEIMYNSLLDGCAQNNLVDEGLGLLEKMQQANVAPSNFTLSLLVKLMNRARKLDQAFTLVEEIAKKYRFRPNVHVYTNLIQACIANRQVTRGMSTFEDMVKERVQPDNRTYTILIRASLSGNQHEQAVGLLRGALGLDGALPYLTHASAVCPSLDYGIVSETLNDLVTKGRVQDFAVPLLSDVKSYKAKVRIDQATVRRVMAADMGEDPGPAPAIQNAGRQPPNAGRQTGFGGDARRGPKGMGKGDGGRDPTWRSNNRS